MGMGSPGSQHLKNPLSDYEIVRQVPSEIFGSKRRFYHILGQMVRMDVVQQQKVSTSKVLVPWTC